MSEESSDAAESKQPFLNKGLTLVWRLAVVVSGGMLLASIGRVLPVVIDGSGEEATAASVVTGSATILLVLFTWRYVKQTRDLVELTKAERRADAAEREREIQSFRRALHNEINAERDWNRFRRWVKRGKPITQPVPTQTFDATPWRVGLLSEKERVPVVKYYQNIANLQQMLNHMEPDSIVKNDGSLADAIDEQITSVNEQQDLALKALKSTMDDQ